MTVLTPPREELHQILEELWAVPGIEAAAIVRRDGLPVQHRLPPDVDPRKVAAMSATLVGTSEMALEELQQGRFLRTVVEAREGKIISIGAGGHNLLVALVGSDANLGMALMTIERQAAKVEETLDSP